MACIMVSELYFTETNCADGNSTFSSWGWGGKKKKKNHNDEEFSKSDNTTRKLEAGSAIFRVSCDSTA